MIKLKTPKDEENIVSNDIVGLYIHIYKELELFQLKTLNKAYNKVILVEDKSKWSKTLSHASSSTKQKFERKIPFKKIGMKRRSPHITINLMIEMQVQGTILEARSLPCNNCKKIGHKQEDWRFIHLEERL